ncbi:type II toxin-antitoxin system PemK/MazF family toxin [Pallidibacillus thermolactis]|jgi:hypothetical protein|uniref:type II toxin-antitoxin system PemK/MazF family toxin n=1 Tax=Pallidibacillus thermolactis TaxID=251051 RepID=UPI00156AC2E9|nr:type II toxin-antitoxin system PemK/MazF family toxin [Pallidibacillus thermolactis]MCU9601732.1 type II toxin-antitoxin system PemK/MazF family toxin [Pallidibacillus thermolactis subsp. kokeshiiformis]
MTASKENKQKQMENGDVYIAFVRYAEDINNDNNPKGKVRPVVIFKDPEDNKLYACKVSSRVDKPLERKFGYIIKDWKEAGFSKPSIVACNRENIREINKTAIHRYIGRLTDRDIKGMLIKHIKVARLEYKIMKEKRNELER